VLSQDATVAGVARRLAAADADGVPADLADHYADHLRAVAATEVRRLIAAYLTPDHYFVETVGARSTVANCQE